MTTCHISRDSFSFLSLKPCYLGFGDVVDNDLFQPWESDSI